MQHADLSLDDRYAKQSGIVYLSGIHALVRALMEQRRLDAEHGLRTAGFVSGYRGSPLAGLDKALWDQQARLDALNLHFQPGVNEELAATAVWGSQQSNLFAGAKYDGVFGLWYGKAPGLDRATDAIRHANFAGTSPNGGVLLVVGDDHGCKSSTLPSHSELALKDLGLPVLNPTDVQDVLDLSLFGWALSRYTGCWSGLVALADTMDSSATVALPRPQFVVPPHDHDVHIRLDDASLDQEQRLFEIKLPLAVEFARANGVNRTSGTTGKAQLGIVTTGRAYLDVRQALFELGFTDERSLVDAGIKILRLGMSWPLDRRLVMDFVAAVPRVLVVEEKRSFVEAELKELLYGSANAPTIIGKRDERGRVLFPSHGEIDVATVAPVLAACLDAVPNQRYLEMLARREAALQNVTARAKTERTPLFCAGCPHNTSTRVPEGSRASAGIGCHYMAQWMDRETHTYTQMGGEGANWVGQAPFTDEPHIFVNLGDGTYFHSGLLAIRQAVAAGVNVTYKILFNDAVAMTGGQQLDGTLTVADVVDQLRAEGVGLISVVSDAPLVHRNLDVPVHHRDRLDDVQKQHRDVSGCNAIIYQQTCATELRRDRKRGLVDDPDVRVMINDAVCEGCGDCSVQSNCVAVEPVATEFGVKRSINQTACNKDLSCLKGFCPAFVLVKGGKLRMQTGVDMGLDELRTLMPLPPATANAGEPAAILVTGVGGTGIVTVSALLGMAAHIEGKAASTLDMTGLAQKGGAVMSHVQIANDKSALHATRLAQGKAQLMLACDMVTGASQEALALLREDAITVVNSSVAPTADFVLHQHSDVQLQHRLRRITAFSGRTLQVDADHCTRSLLGDTAQTNVFLLGFAFQQGAIPLSVEALETAISLNGVAVEQNLKAFHFGRLAAHDERALPDAVRRSTSAVMDPKQTHDLASTIAQRKAHLTDYQDVHLATRYQKLLDRVAQKEQEIKLGSEQLTRTVAETYAKLLAVKDEYEVARLYTDGRWQAKLEERFEGDYAVSYLLAPPLLTKNNVKRRFGSWMGLGFKLLAKLKRLRGTWFDPFAYTRDRRQDQRLIGHFETLVDTLLNGLDGQNLNIAARIARLGLEAKGYGHVKSRAIERMLEAERELLEEFHRPPSPVTLFDPKVGRHAA